jgi:hypothetical protein
MERRDRYSESVYNIGNTDLSWTHRPSEVIRIRDRFVVSIGLLRVWVVQVEQSLSDVCANDIYEKPLDRLFVLHQPVRTPRITASCDERSDS